MSKRIIILFLLIAMLSIVAIGSIVGSQTTDAQAQPADKPVEQTRNIRRSAIDTYDSWTRTFTEIKRNVPVDDSLFTPPAVPK